MPYLTLLLFQCQIFVKTPLFQRSDHLCKRSEIPIHCPHTRFAGQKNNLYNGKG